ncbi:MAG: type III pantothenate kinase [Bacteroidota bacterium]
MDLIVDLGNTNKKLAIFNDGRLIDIQLFSVLSMKILHDFTRHYPGIQNCIFSSVTSYRASITKFLSGNFHFFDFDENTLLPIINRYKSKKTLGKDRLAAAVAGANHFPGKNVLVINAGTCITYDFVSDRNEYFGGAISPGILMRFHALHTFSGRLPLVSFRNTMILTGKDTEESILSGVLTGSIAEIEGIANKYRQKYPDIEIILSGGDYKYFDKRLKISIFALPNIVIHGLHQILAFNVNKAK